MAFPWKEALPVAGNLLGGVADVLTGSRNTKLTIRAQKEQADLAYQRAIEMWHMQNEYNSPAEQMKRFGAAGLNPHLIYGQGSPGNANSMPQYQAPNLQYRFASPGPAIASTLPTLMAAGTWMQNMRASEVDIKAKETQVEKAEQLIAFLEQQNPRKIRELDNKLQLYPHQKSMMQAEEKLAWQKWNDMLQEYRYKWTDGASEVKGAKFQEYLKLLAERRLKEAQADWFEPATIMKLVMAGVFGLSGVGGKLAGRVAGRAAGKAKPRIPSKGQPGYNSTDFWRKLGVYKR